MSGFVYAIERDDGLIKIGFSTAPRNRLVALRCQHKLAMYPLGVLPDSERADERRCHRELAADRDHGEWFRPSLRVVRFVSDMQPWPEPQRRKQKPLPSPLIAPDDTAAILIRSRVTGVSRIESLQSASLHRSAA